MPLVWHALSSLTRQVAHEFNRMTLMTLGRPISCVSGSEIVRRVGITHMA